MGWRGFKLSIGEINLCPVILSAKAILAVPDTSKRKSEYKVIDHTNKEILANPKIEPRLFLECSVVGEYWGNGPRNMVIDVDNREVYKNITGSAYNAKRGTSRYYLKRVKSYYIDPNTITNLEDVLKLVLDNQE